jgi:localization factor PodJL
MNPGGTSPRRNEMDEGERGEELQNRLSHLAERLERLATAPGPARGDSGRSMSAAANASDDFAVGSTTGGYEAPPAWNDLDDDDSNPADDDVADPSGMAEIAAALRELDDHPENAGKDKRQAAAASTPAPDPESRLAAIRRRIDALRSRRDEPPAKARSEAKALPPAKALASGEAKAERAATAAAIAERQQTGSTTGAPNAMRPMTPPSPPAVEDKLSMALSALSARNDKPAQAAPAPAATVSAAMAPVATPPAAAAIEAKSDDIAGLSRQLDELRRLIRASAADTDMSALEAGQSVIMERLDQLARRNSEAGFEEMARQILQRVPPSERIDAMSLEIDRLSERVASLDHREELGRIEARLSSFEERLSTVPGPAAAPADTQPLETAIAAVRESLDGLTRMLKDDGAPAWTRLEERLNQVSDRFEATLENAPRADSVAELFERLEALAARGESAPPAIEALAKEIADIRAREHSELASLDTHIQALARRLDEAIGGKLFDTGAMEDLEARILALSGRLDDLANAEPSTDHAVELRQVEDQLAQLSGRIDQIDTSGQSSDGLVALEGQVADLMSRLEQLSSDHSSLLLIQENLSKLEVVVSESGRQSPDAVQQAARDAVRELANLGGAQQGSATLEALKSDLKALQRAAQDNDRQTGATLDKVHETLDRVVMRLSGLEEEIRDRSGKPAEPRRAPVIQAEDAEPASDVDDWMPIPPDQPLIPDAPRPRVTSSGVDREMRADFIAVPRRRQRPNMRFSAPMPSSACRRNSPAIVPRAASGR